MSLLTLNSYREDNGSECLISKSNVDTLETINEKPTSRNVGDFQKSSSYDVTDYIDCNDNINIADTPNLYKKTGAFVSKKRHFIKYIPSEKAAWLRQHHTTVYLLLSLAVERARWEKDVSLDGLIFGDAILGSYKEAGLSRQQYRDAIEKGESLGIWEVVWNPKIPKHQKRTIKRTIKSIVVNIKESDIWDINIKIDNHDENHQGTIKEPQTKTVKIDKNKDKQPLTPSFEEVVDVSFSKEIEIEEKVHVCRDVYLSKKDLQDCIEVKGSLENVKQAIESILSWGGRKYEITDWPRNIKKWEVKNLAKDRRQENEQYGKTLEKKFSDISRGWRCRNYRNNSKDDTGLLFECVGAQNGETIFISYSDSNFTEKANDLVNSKKMECK